MRILHTSDWHLGQHFMGKSRESEHQAFIEWLLTTIDEQSVDAVIIAGDIFDTGTPPSYARSLYNRFIVELKNTRCRHLIVVGGNHDSVSTLNESRELLAHLNTTVIGGVAADPDDQLVVLTEADGSEGAIVCAIPFIRPRDVLESRAGDSGSDKHQALLNAMQNHYQSIFSRAEKKGCELAGEAGLPIIATGHLTTVGGQLSESVRELYIGTLTGFPASAFPPADYIALGHLHRAQRVSGYNHIRYSGSPLPLSFDETGNQKQVLLVDFAQSREPDIQALDVPVFQRLASLKGSLSTIESEFDTLLKNTNEESLWLEVEVGSDDYVSDLQNQVMALIEEKSEGRSVSVLRITRKRQSRGPGLTAGNNETLAELKVEDVFSRRLQEESLEPEQICLLEKAFTETLAAVEQALIEDVDSTEKQKENA